MLVWVKSTMEGGTIFCKYTHNDQITLKIITAKPQGKKKQLHTLYLWKELFTLQINVRLLKKYTQYGSGNCKRVAPGKRPCPPPSGRLVPCPGNVPILWRSINVYDKYMMPHSRLGCPEILLDFPLKKANSTKETGSFQISCSKQQNF